MKEGFTLTEIMIVVTIIGLIVMIAMPNYLETRRKATMNVCVSNQKLIYTAATNYMLNEAVSLVPMTDSQRLTALLNNGYLKGTRWPECPEGGIDYLNDFTITFSGNIVADVECDKNPAEHVWP
jgi:prepilin-type N-terminal cleavage/methylation domain-containing protein